jgi:hypothetical protein
MGTNQRVQIDMVVFFMLAILGVYTRFFSLKNLIL